MENNKLNQGSRQSLADTLTQLGIGGMTTGVNYDNVQGNMYEGLMKALGTAGTGVGDWLESKLP